MTSQKGTGSRRKKRITAKEREFADLMIETGLGSIEAARKVFGWKCEPGTSEYRKAVDLKTRPRLKEYMNRVQSQIKKQTEAHQIFLDVDRIEWDKLRKFAFNRLKETRDKTDLRPAIRFNAIKAIETLSDPSTDTNLILMWLDLLWRGALVHCPSCHNTFPLRYIKNKTLHDWREQTEADPEASVQDMFGRRMEILSRADKRKRPHETQIKALSAPERHIAGLGPARSGKSFLLAQLALLAWLTPGVEVWVLARIYDDARSEVEYLKKFINTLFYPYYKHVVSEREDVKTGELILKSKWGSELRIMSAKAKGSISGRELEMVLIAEPGWVPDDIFNHIRARMSSRLGRIIMLGTPQGFGGLLGRMVRLTGRDPKTRKVIRITPEQRTIAAGCPWNVSMLVYNMDPKDNPEYVQSELQAARMELTDAEYASEFEGIMASAQGAKFPQIRPEHLVRVSADSFRDCVFVLGVDQGPKNFGAILLGFNNKKIFVVKEFFQQDTKTMKVHMGTLMNKVPIWLERRGVDRSAWKATIFDADPPIFNELEEFENEGKPWPTEVQTRPKNMRGQYTQDNWRSETYEFVNSSAMNGDLMFDLEHCDLIHDQLIRAQDVPAILGKETNIGTSKGWNINDPWRGDHVVDAFILAMWVVLSGGIVRPETLPSAQDPWSEANAAFMYQIAKDEKSQMTGMIPNKEIPDDESLFEKHFGRKRGSNWLAGTPGYYPDES